MKKLLPLDKMEQSLALKFINSVIMSHGKSTHFKSTIFFLDRREVGSSGKLTAHYHSNCFFFRNFCGKNLLF